MTAASIVANLAVRYDQAITSGDLIFSTSTVTKHTEFDVEFGILLCPALQRKPKNISAVKAEAEQSIDKAVHVDPFAPPYNPNLHLGDLQSEEGQAYAVIFNKYPVIPRHFILTTKEYQAQTSPLHPSDLAQAYQLLVAAKKAGTNYLAFYNCGEYSGASQPHKHLQFIPIDDDGPPIERLARSVRIDQPNKSFAINKLPYANHVFRLPSQLSTFSTEQLEETLAQAFLLLLDLVISTIRHDPDYTPGKPSYNVLITLEHIHLIPRRQEAYVLPGTDDVIAINSLGFAGLLLAKNEAELAAIKETGIGTILSTVGLQSVHDLQVVEGGEEQ